MTLTWQSNNGTSWPFDGSQGVTCVNEARGLFHLPLDIAADPRVFGDGSALVNTRFGPRPVDMELMVDDDVEARSLWADLYRAMFAGGSLHYDRDGARRSLRSVVLESPDRSMLGRDLGETPTDVFAVSLLALDPWWYGGTEQITGSFASETGWDAAISWDTAVPWNGGASVGLMNLGDASTPVTIIVRGAASSVTFALGGTGWTTSSGLDTLEYFSVSADPARPGPHMGPHGIVAEADGPVKWSLLTEGSQWFYLPSGESEVVFEAVGADGNTAWWMQWAPRYLTP